MALRDERKILTAFWCMRQKLMSLEGQIYDLQLNMMIGTKTMGSGDR
jgi:hypothetical protein